MAKKQLNEFEKAAISERERLQIKGGINYIPGNTGSTGYINWDDVIIRGDEFATPASNATTFGFVSVKKGK